MQNHSVGRVRPVWPARPAAARLRRARVGPIAAARASLFQGDQIPNPVFCDLKGSAAQIKILLVVGGKDPCGFCLYLIRCPGIFESNEELVNLVGQLLKGSGVWLSLRG